MFPREGLSQGLCKQHQTSSNQWCNNVLSTECMGLHVRVPRLLMDIIIVRLLSVILERSGQVGRSLMTCKRQTLWLCPSAKGGRRAQEAPGWAVCGKAVEHVLLEGWGSSCKRDADWLQCHCEEKGAGAWEIQGEAEVVLFSLKRRLWSIWLFFEVT